MNLCVSCGEKFGSVSAFDAHRVGTHEYTSIQGLKMDPPREDGRRCLHRWELESAVDKKGQTRFELNKHGSWSLSTALARAREWNTSELGGVHA